MRARKSTPEMERLLCDDDAEPRALRRVIGLVVSDQLFEHEPRLRALAEHADPGVRSEAVLGLVGIWGREEMFERGFQMMREDPSLIARGEASGGFSVWLARKGVGHPRRADVIDQMIRALKAVMNDGDREANVLKVILYDEIMTGITGKTCEAPDDFDPATDIDWDVLDDHLLKTA